MSKNTKPLRVSRTVISNGSLLVAFSITSLLIAVVNAAGSATLFCGTSAIDPCSAPRKRSLNTRMLKKEFAATANWARSSFALANLIPFRRFTSSSMVTVPFSTIIF